MRNLQTKLLIISIVILCVISTVIGYNAYDNFIIGLLSIFIALIPGIYSIIPLLQEQLKEINMKKNRYTNLLFTDRHEDIENIINKLMTEEHIIEIKGNDEQCGKTWLAKRLCDFINFPNDIINQEIKVKCKYHRAYYLDMNKYDEKEINVFFEQNIINTKTVLIIDNVEDLDIIINKQKLYHFQLIYISKKDNSRELHSHIVTQFSQQNIGDLQRKIRKNYPEINDLNQKEINVLFQLTNGNIGKITTLLCEQRCIKWIKDIANNKQTEYDERLNKIQAILYIGKYNIAKEKLEEFKNEFNEQFEGNNDLNYKYILKLSDCEHLLNNYKNAISILSIVENEKFKLNNNNFEVELHKAHYYKHLWKCNEALEILQSLKYQSYTAMVDALGILIAKYFIDDLYVPMSELNSLDEFKNFYKCAESSSLSHNDDDKLKFSRCTAIYLFYTKYPKDYDEMIKKINDVIHIYEAQHNRLLANAYFIRGEIYRLYKEYNLSLKDYRRCLNVTHDDNILIQVNLMVYYLKKCKKIKLDFELLKYDKIINMCEKNNYAQKLFEKIKCIELDDPNSNNIQTCFDTRIMPIL